MRALDNFSVQKDVFVSVEDSEKFVITIPKTFSPEGRFKFVGCGTYKNLINDMKAISNDKAPSFFINDYDVLRNVQEAWQASIILLNLSKNNLLQKEGVQLAFNNHAYVDLQDDLGFTPLMYTAMNEAYDAGTMLLQKGANANLMNNNRQKAKSLANPAFAHIYSPRICII